jgi:hypothetical protein
MSFPFGDPAAEMAAVRLPKWQLDPTYERASGAVSAAVAFAVMGLATTP